MSDPISTKFADFPDESSNDCVRLQTTVEGVAMVTLNRPARKNAFDSRTIATLTEVFQTLAGAEGVRVVFLWGAGGNFSAGADIDWMREAGGKSEADNRADALDLATMLKALYDLPMLTVALVQGVAFGGGAGLIAACDVAMVTAEAQFAFSEVKLGLTPATISPYVVQAIGPRAARRLFATGERFGAEEALRIGLIDQIVRDPTEMSQRQEVLVGTIMGNAPGAVAAAKALVEQVKGRPIDHPLLAETAQLIAARRASPEGREGLAAFIEKRPPNWAT